MSKIYRVNLMIPDCNINSRFLCDVVTDLELLVKPDRKFTFVKEIITGEKFPIIKITREIDSFYRVACSYDDLSLKAYKQEIPGCYVRGIVDFDLCLNEVKSKELACSRLASPLSVEYYRNINDKKILKNKLKYLKEAYDIRVDEYQKVKRK